MNATCLSAFTIIEAVRHHFSKGSVSLALVAEILSQLADVEHSGETTDSRQ